MTAGVLRRVSAHQCYGLASLEDPPAQVEPARGVRTRLGRQSSQVGNLLNNKALISSRIRWCRFSRPESGDTAARDGRRSDQASRRERMRA